MFTAWIHRKRPFRRSSFWYFSLVLLCLSPPRVSEGQPQEPSAWSSPTVVKTQNAEISFSSKGGVPVGWDILNSRRVPSKRKERGEDDRVALLGARFLKEGPDRALDLLPGHLSLPESLEFRHKTYRVERSADP